MTVAAVRVQPFEGGDELGGQLDAFGVDAEAALVDLTFPGDNIKIAAGGLGIENGAVVIFDLFKTAETALPAACFPLAVCSSRFLILPRFFHKSLHLPAVLF